MHSSFRTPLRPQALADGEKSLTGALDAARLDRRLADALAMHRVVGEVSYEFDFRRLATGAVGVSGHLHACLTARCQRCLEPFDLELDTAPWLQLADASANADAMAVPKADREWVELPECPTLADLIEEEILLGLPFAPRHPPAECPAAGLAADAEQEHTQRPFEGLDRALAARKAYGKD